MNNNQDQEEEPENDPGQESEEDSSPEPTDEDPIESDPSVDPFRETEGQDRGEETILIVDDSEKIRRIVTHFLEDDYELLTAVETEEAYQLMNKHDIDLLLLDVMLPQKDGITFMKELKEEDRFKDIPVLIMSARRDKKTVVQSVTEGAEDYVLKPFDRETLLDKIRKKLK